MRRPGGVFQTCVRLPLLLLLAGCGKDAARDEETVAPLSGAVSAGTPEATRAGLDVLSRGGNAVDAAVAVSLTLGVTEPSQSGLGGRVVMLFHPAGGTPVLVHVPPPSDPTRPSPKAVVPTALRVLQHAWNRHGSGNLTWEELVEPAIRAAEDGYALGRFRHRTLVREYDKILADSASARVFLAEDRSIPSEQTLITTPALAATLERVARDGADALYQGELAELLVRDLSRRGAAVTLEDLAALPAVQETPPLEGSYRGRKVWTLPEPYGGPFVLAALRFLEQAPPVALHAGGWARTAWVVEALAYARGGAASSPIEHLRGLPPMPLPVADSLSPPWAEGAPGTGYGADTSSRQPPRPRGDRATPPAPPRGRTPGDTAAGRRPGRDTAVGRAGRDTAGGRSGPDTAVGRPGRDTAGAAVRLRPPGGREETTHFSIVDQEGNAVVVTQTLGAPFGAGWMAPGLGFFYNDEWVPPLPTPPDSVAQADTAAGARDGTPPGADAPRSPAGPGDGERTAVGSAAGAAGSIPMAPTIITSDGRVELALGSPGGERGLAAIVQVIVTTLDLQEPLDRATGARRIYVGDVDPGGRPRVYLEGVVWSDGGSAGAADTLWGAGIDLRIAERGFTVGERDLGPILYGLDSWFGGVNGVAREGEGWRAAGDERRDGVGGVLVDGSWSLQGEPGGVTAPPPEPPPRAGAGG